MDFFLPGDNGEISGDALGSDTDLNVFKKLGNDFFIILNLPVGGMPVFSEAQRTLAFNIYQWNAVHIKQDVVPDPLFAVVINLPGDNEFIV